MAKKVEAYIKLQVPAGQANPSPPVGPALGQHGVNIMEFCKAFNASTQSVEQGLPIPVVITVYNDRSFTHPENTAGIGSVAKVCWHCQGQWSPEYRKGRQGFSRAARRDCNDEKSRSDRR